MNFLHTYTLIFEIDFLLYYRAKTRPPNLGFWTLAATYFQTIIAFSQRNRFGASETEKYSKEINKCKYQKKLNHFFLYDWEKHRPPNLGFRTLAIIYFKTILYFQKNQFGASETGNCSKETKLVQISQTFLFLNHIFLYHRAKNWPPPPT